MDFDLEDEQEIIDTFYEKIGYPRRLRFLDACHDNSIKRLANPLGQVPCIYSNDQSRYNDVRKKQLAGLKRMLSRGK